VDVCNQRGDVVQKGTMTMMLKRRASAE